MGRLELSLPLRLAWSSINVGGQPLISEVGIVVPSVAGTGGIEALSHQGEKRWMLESPNVTAALAGDAVLLTLGPASPERLQVRSLVDGRIRRDVPCPIDLGVLLESGRVCAGVTTLQPARGVFLDWVSVTILEPELILLWKREALRPSGYSMHLVSDGSGLFVGHGSDLVAIRLGDGTEMWSSPITDDVGGATDHLHWWLMVKDGVVVTNARRGTVAYSAETGERLWAVPGGGARAIYGGRVYFMHDEAYHILDLHTGVVLLRRDVALEIGQKWRLDQVQFKSHPAVSETHTFVGDARGRIFGFVRDTGEPVWYDQPPGVTSFWGAKPVIADRRLYISSFSIDAKRPPYLYCYEEAPEGSWEPPKTRRRHKSGRV